MTWPFLYNIISPKLLSHLIAGAICLNFLLILFYSVLNAKSIKENLHLSAKSAYLVSLIFLTALLLRIFFSPYAHNDFYTEWDFMKSAQSMILKGSYSVCYFGYESVCHTEPVILNYPAGVPFIFAFSFLFFGVNDAAAFNANIFFSSLSVVPVFLAGYLLSKKEEVGLFSAFLLAVTPLHIKYSGTALIGPTAVFFQAITVFFFLNAINSNRKGNWLLFLLSLSYAIQTRPEYFLFPVLFILGYFILRPNKQFQANISWYHFAIFAFLSFPNAYNIASYFSVNSWKMRPDVAYISTGHAFNNVVHYAYFWFNTHYQLLLFPFLFLAGVFYLWARERKVFGFIAVWFGIFLVFCIFYWHDPLKMNQGFRYVQVCVLPFSVFMGFGAAYIYNLLPNRLLLVAGLGVIIISFSAHIPYMRYLDNIRTVEYEMINKARGKIDTSCFVIGHTVLLSIDEKIKFILPYLINEGRVTYAQLREVTDCLYLFKDMSSIERDWPRQILESCPHKTIMSKEVKVNRPEKLSTNFAFYELDFQNCSKK